MELISYEEFSKLRIADFFPAGTQLFLEETGSTECAIGSAATEGKAFTYFAWRPEEPRKTAEIALDFREECPPEIGERILKAIKLPLTPGMTADQIKRVMGPPEYSALSKSRDGVVRFLCGHTWPYFVACTFTKSDGLIGLTIFRKDYADDD